MKEKIFTILGGDTRYLELSKQLVESGYQVNLYGFKENEEKSHLKIFLKNSNFIIFPMPISKNKIDLYASFSTKKIKLVEINKENLLKNKIIFTPGLIKSELEPLKISEKNTIFKYGTEEFLVKNAQLTAEATIKIVEKKLRKNLKNESILICGFGRLGQALAKILKNKCKNLTISARKEVDFKKIENLSIKSINTKDIEKITEKNVIINTIPALIFDEKTLKKSVKNALLIDLASNPGGVDKKAVKKLRIKHIHALGLPGKFYPKESAALIKSSILKTIDEKNIY